MGTLLQKYHSQQGGLLKPLSVQDIMVVDQPDNTTATKYRTKGMSVNLLNNKMFTDISTGAIASPVSVDSTGIDGSGSSSDPYTLSEEWLNANFSQLGYINISQIGDLRTSVLPFAYNNSILTVTDPIRILFAGNNTSIPEQSVDLSAFGVVNKTIKVYLYLTMDAGKIVLEPSNVGIAELIDQTLIATIEMTGSVITNVIAVPFARIDRYRLTMSDDSQQYQTGSSIPFSGSGLGAMDLNYTLWE